MKNNVFKMGDFKPLDGDRKAGVTSLRLGKVASAHRHDELQRPCDREIMVMLWA